MIKKLLRKEYTLPDNLPVLQTVHPYYVWKDIYPRIS